jgi:hypothetical protein
MLSQRIGKIVSSSRGKSQANRLLACQHLIEQTLLKLHEGSSSRNMQASQIHFTLRNWQTAPSIAPYVRQ